MSSDRCSVSLRILSVVISTLILLDTAVAQNPTSMSSGSSSSSVAASSASSASSGSSIATSCSELDKPCSDERTCCGFPDGYCLGRDQQCCHNRVCRKEQTCCSPIDGIVGYCVNESEICCGGNSPSCAIDQTCCTDGTDGVESQYYCVSIGYQCCKGVGCSTNQTCHGELSGVCCDSNHFYCGAENPSLCCLNGLQCCDGRCCVGTCCTAEGVSRCCSNGCNEEGFCIDDGSSSNGGSSNISHASSANEQNGNSFQSVAIGVGVITTVVVGAIVRSIWKHVRNKNTAKIHKSFEISLVGSELGSLQK